MTVRIILLPVLECCYLLDFPKKVPFLGGNSFYPALHHTQQIPLFSVMGREEKNCPPSQSFLASETKLYVCISLFFFRGRRGCLDHYVKQVRRGKL